MVRTAADVLIDTLTDYGVEVIFGLPGGGINGIMESLRTRRDRVRFVQGRHEESAAFMACGYAAGGASPPGRPRGSIERGTGCVQSESIVLRASQCKRTLTATSDVAAHGKPRSIKLVLSVLSPLRLPVPPLRRGADSTFDSGG
jgi:hypothetical protein